VPSLTTTVTTDVAAHDVVRRARSARTRRGRLLLTGAVVVLVLVVAVALSTGAAALGPSDLVRTALGAGDPAEEFVLLRLRLPRVAVAVLAGVGFGLAGGLFQTVLHNPLASPDILGIAGGASVGAVASTLLLGWDGVAVSAAAFLGAVAVAGGILLFSWRAGVAGHRFVLVGIAAAMLVHAALGYLLTRADVRDVPQALVWMVGSTASARWAEIGLVAGAYAVLLPGVVAASRGLRALQLGDEAARGLGLAVDARRVLLLALAVALVATATAVVGPIAFVAFVAGPVARRLHGSGEPALALSAAVGVVVVTAADVIGQHLLPFGVQVPVGVVTALVGAPYLLWLLASSRVEGGTR
jgi:iron complex transport system permease protein